MFFLNLYIFLRINTFRKCTRKLDNKIFAVKIVSQKFAYHAIREICILEMLNPHENIVKIIEAISDPVHYYIILELLEGGELLNRLRKMIKFTEQQAANIMSQLVSAVSHMHSYDVVHRDLKPEVRFFFIMFYLFFRIFYLKTIARPQNSV